MSKPGTPAATAAKRPMSPFKKLALVGIVLVLALSVGARAFFSGEGSKNTSDGKAQVGPSSVEGQGLVEGQPGTGTPEGGAPAGKTAEVEEKLPYVTEASFFALIGFALGYASRKFVKVGLILLALFFVGLQVLVYMNVVDIDWGRGVELVNKFVLNIQEGDSVKKVITDKLPTAGALTAGYFLGFRKG